MILDTNALSAWAEGDRAIEPVLRSATEMMIPAVVLGEFEFGIRQSRHYSINAVSVMVEIFLRPRKSPSMAATQAA